jgi:dsRNA-specific ribonuclease
VQRTDILKLTCEREVPYKVSIVTLIAVLTLINLDDSMNSTSTASTSTLKRSRSNVNGTPEHVKDDLPPLPRISGEHLLQVFTHKSLRRPSDDPDFDNRRLSKLGERAFDTAITAVLFNIRPVLRNDEIMVSHLSDFPSCVSYM